MQVSESDPMIALLETWSNHFGYYDDKIDLKVQDLTSFVSPDCTLTAHAPAYGVKVGQEKPLPVADVRTQLARILKFGGRPCRHNMHLAIHPDGKALCLFFEIRVRFGFVPLTLRTIPVAFVVLAAQTTNGLRISEVHEWVAADPDAALQVLVDEHAWPADTTMQPYVSFGAKS